MRMIIILLPQIHPSRIKHRIYRFQFFISSQPVLSLPFPRRVIFSLKKDVIFDFPPALLPGRDIVQVIALFQVQPPAGRFKHMKRVKAG